MATLVVIKNIFDSPNNKKVNKSGGGQSQWYVGFEQKSIIISVEKTLYRNTILYPRNSFPRLMLVDDALL